MSVHPASRAHVLGPACALMMVLPTLVAALGGVSAASGVASPWPPQAWEDGDLSDLSLVELALLASDLTPTKQNLHELERDLAPLETMPPEHTEVTRIVLEGLAGARWHQEQALRGLDDHQLAILFSADPDRPVPPGWDEVMAAVDHRELAKALLSLESASMHATGILQNLNAEPAPTIAGVLADALDLPAHEGGPGRLVAPPLADSTVALAVQVAGGFDALERDALSDALEATPPQARAALHTILEALNTLADAPTDRDAALVGLGVAVDDARDTLRIWSTAAMAERIHHVRTSSGVIIPDADADRPPLHFGVPRLRDPDAALPPPPGLAEALREVALALGDSDTARDAEAHMAALATVLGVGEAEAVAQVLHQTAHYLTAQRTATLVPMPSVLMADSGLLSTWASLEDLPLPGSPEAQSLLAARPYLSAQLEAALAREDLMTAVQDAVAALAPQPQPAYSPLPSLPRATAPASSHEPVPCDLERIRVPQTGPAYLHVDPCGRDDQWAEEDLALLIIDTGGNDTYTGAYGGAPFTLGTVPTQGPIISPVVLHLDLDGSDIYDAEGMDCALGSACAPHSSSQSHLAVLIDWQGNDTDARNEFHSGNRSMGYSGDGSLPGTGLLVERVGANSHLASKYEAGDHSQGAVGLEADAISLVSFQPPGVGALLRVVGRDAEAEGSFRAAGHSQGSMDLQGVMEQAAVAALVNVAGANASSHDVYVAGTFSQGASRVQTTTATGTASGGTLALLADVIGPGGRSDDSYRAGDKSRAHGENAYFLDILLPETVEQEGLVETTALDASDPVGSLPEEPGAELGIDPLQSATSVTVNSTGPRSSSNDTYILVGNNPKGNGFAISNSPVLFLDLGGTDVYPASNANAGTPGNSRSWSQPPPLSGFPPPVPTGIDGNQTMDQDGDLIPFAIDGFQTSDKNPNDLHPTGRRVLLDMGGQYGFLNTTHALVVSLAGDTVYGTNFTSALLLDLAGNDEYLGRTAAAAGPTITGSLASPQNILSFSLDLEGNDRYESAVNGTMGFGAGGAAGILFDLHGSDHYQGTNYTQGVGVTGGLGVLVDLKGSMNPETNRFRANGTPAQGSGEGGLGILVADGDHNTFQDGGDDAAVLPSQVPQNLRDAAGDPNTPTPDGVHRNDGGASYNGGDNTAPSIVSSDWSGSAIGHAVAGVPYTFTATVKDSENDRVEVCWTFTEGVPDEHGILPRTRLCETVEGSGTVELEHAWTNVPTDAHHGGKDEHLDYSFDLTATDPGALEDRVENPVQVFNDPPRRTGEGVRTPQVMLPKVEYAIQVPFIAGDDAPNATTPAVLVSDWGDEPLAEPESFNATAVDWGKSRWGARVEVPFGYPDSLSVSEQTGALTNVIDDDSKTTVAFSHQRQFGVPTNAPATIVVWFEGARQVHQVGVNASLSKTSGAQEVSLSLDLQLRDGSTRPVGTAILHADRPCHPCMWNLTDFPDAVGLVLRQVVPADAAAATHVFDVGDLFARGPGATHAWPAVGAYDVEYTVLDRYAGRNGITATVAVLSGAVDGPEGTAPLRLADIGGRGPARHASLVANPLQAQGILLESHARAQGDAYCIDWGDGTVDCGPDGTGIPVPDGGFTSRQKTWGQSGDNGYDVELIYYPAGRPADGSGGERWPLTTVYVEQGLDLRPDASTPLLFLTFDVHPTWHEGLVDAFGSVTPYQAIVDAGGDDRYLGRVASSLPVPASSGLQLPQPSLVADVGGDDVYLDVPRGGPLGSQVDAWDLDAGAPLAHFPRGNAIGWVDCNQNTPPRLDEGDCVFLDVDAPGSSGSGVVSVGDIVLNRIPGSDVPAGGVMTAASQGIGTPMRMGAFLPVYVDADGSGAYNSGDVVYLDDPEGTGKGLDVLSQGDIQVSGDGFGIMQNPGVPETSMGVASLSFCSRDTDGDGGYNGGEPVYLAASGCGTVEPDDVRIISVALGRTQAFATHFGVSLLLDAGGSDVYVAHGEAQAAATRGGVTALLDLGGHDAFNPLPADHPAVAAASPQAPEPWLDRPAVLQGGRPLGTGPDLVQGAAEDGVAILVTAGEVATFHAGMKSQGYGSHEAATVDHYAIPGADLACGSPISTGPGVQVNVNPLALACLLGIRNVQDPIANPGFYTNTAPVSVPAGPGPNPGFDSGNHLWCTDNSQNLGNQIGSRPCPSSQPDTSVLSAFVNGAPRYNLGLGALVRLGGPALYHAGGEAQGSAGNAGRGLLMDLDGGSAFTAHERSQAFSANGIAGTIIGGSSVLRIGSDGQATIVGAGDGEPGSVTGRAGPEAGLTDNLAASILLTMGSRDVDCKVGTCGQGGQDLPVPAMRLPGPDMTVATPTGPIDHAGTEEVLVNLPEGEDLQVVAFAIVYPDWSGGSNLACSGAPLAAPTLLFNDKASGALLIPLDLGALVAGTDPLLPAGCTEVHAFARSTTPQDVGGTPVSLTEWGHDSGSVLVLPPIRGMRLVGADGFSTNGRDVVFKVRVPEPLATTLPDPPEVAFRLTPGSVTTGFSSAWQSDGTLQVEWAPPGGLDGTYVLESRARWPGAEWSGWAAVLGASGADAQVLVDRTPAIVDPDLGSAPDVVRYRQDITLGGVASDTSGVDVVGVRLLDADGDAILLHEPCMDPRSSPPLHDLFDVDETQLACARLGAPGPDGVAWHATFRPSNTFQAGIIRVQVNALDGGGVVGAWLDAATVLLDSAAPRVTAVRTPDGFEAAGPSPDDGNSTVRLRVHLCDGATPEDACSAVGVKLESVAISATRVTEDGDLERIPLERAPELDASAVEGLVLGYDWTSGDGSEIPEGTYDLFIMARDRAGNLFDHNPAHPFAVDRTRPVLDEPEVFLPEMTRPDGEVVLQQAVKQGDMIHLVLSGQESNPAAINAAIPDLKAPLTATTTPWTNIDGQAVSLQVPPAADGGTGVMEMEVQVTDLAGNAAARTMEVPFVTPFDFLDDPQADSRADSAVVSWSLNRALDGPGDGLLATLLNAGGAPLHQATPESPNGDASYEVWFPDLHPERDYKVLVQAWDGANNTLEKVLSLTTLSRPVGTEIQATTRTGTTYSGWVPIEGHLNAGAADIRGDLSLHVGHSDAPPARFRVGSDPTDDTELVESHLLHASLGERQDFALLWDSRDHVLTDSGAQIVDVEVRFDDGSTAWSDVLSLRIDNTPPTITPVVEGPVSNDGWYNGTIVVRGAAEDDTQRSPPASQGVRPNLLYRTAIGSGPAVQTDSVTLAADGTHEVTFSVSDGALPPNTAVLSTTVHIDRTPPSLEVESGLDDPWTNQPLIPLSVQASDGGSGLDGFRVRVDDEAWVPSSTVPAQVSLSELPDGEHWIDIEVRDVARNTQRETLNVLLDRAAPSIVDVRWIGWSQGTPVLHVVAEDLLEGVTEGRPSGIDAIRFSAASASGPWTDWAETGISGVFSVTGGNGGAWLQVRDQAGNVASPVAVEAPPEADEAVSEPNVGAASTTLLGQAAVAPSEGSPETRFTFSTKVRPMNSTLPDKVILHVADQNHSMLAEGPVLEDGARMHTATITLPPSRLDEPYVFHVTAHYGDRVVESTVAAGPTVYALGLRDLAHDDVSQDAPSFGLGMLLALLLTSLILYHRRNRS